MNHYVVHFNYRAVRNKDPPSIRNAYPISADFGGKNKERFFFQILEISKNKERLFEKRAAGENFGGLEAWKCDFKGETRAAGENFGDLDARKTRF